MSVFLFSLEKGSKKHICPGCGKKTFVRFVNTKNDEYLPEKYGRCDRSIKCKYFENPYKDGYAYEHNRKNQAETNTIQSLPLVRKAKSRSIIYVPDEIFKATKCCYAQNVFIQNLMNGIQHSFELPEIEKVIELYHLGTIQDGYLKGAVTFPYFERLDQIRAVQIIQYDKDNHRKRIHWIDKYAPVINKYNKDWLEKYAENEGKVTCLFGAHLIHEYPNNPIAIVESAKSAIVATLYYGLPEKDSKKMIWLGAFSRDALSLHKCKILSGRAVYLIPDLSMDGSTYRVWKEKSEAFKRAMPTTRFKIVDTFEIKANQPDRDKGLDIADYLVQFDWRKFRSM